MCSRLHEQFATVYGRLTNVSDASERDIRLFHLGSLRNLSDSVPHEAYQSGLRFRLALKSKSLLEDVNVNDGLVNLRNYLRNKKIDAERDRWFAAQLLTILDSHCGEYFSEIERVIALLNKAIAGRMLTAKSERLSKALVSNTALKRRDLQTQVNHILNDANTALQFTTEPAVKQFSKNKPVDEETCAGVFEHIIAESEEQIGILLGKSLLGYCRSLYTGPIVNEFYPRQCCISRLLSVVQKQQLTIAGRVYEECRPSGQENCSLFQALSLGLTDFATESYDAELRAKTLRYLFDNWVTYSAAYFALNQLEQACAIENLILSTRRFNPFSCRLVHVLPQVVKRKIRMVVQSKAAGEWLKVDVGNAEETAEEEPLLLVARFNPNKYAANEGKEYSVSVLKSATATYELVPDALSQEKKLFEFGSFDYFT